MRTDDSTARESFRQPDKWRHNPITGETKAETDQRMATGDEIANGKMEVHSLSGNERNHLFINERSGDTFRNLSAVSGMDSEADGRGMALLDYDRDGWMDVAVVNANAPLTQLYHNDIAQVSKRLGGMIAVRFLGGNRTASASEFCNRDGYGAKVEVVLPGGATLYREHRCGEGFAAQGSKTMLIGVGGAGAADVTVRWPSGEAHSIGNVPEGTLVTAHETGDEKFALAEYRTARGSRPAEIPRSRFPVAQEAGGGLHVYTTTATWCASCIGHLSAFARLAEVEGMRLFGVPVDPDDDREKLEAYVEQRRPSYTMLADLDADQKEAVSAFLGRETGRTEVPLPMTVITDAEGRVLEVMPGVPTVSDVRRILAER